ncbi:alginate lyase family protein [Paenibacillus sp. N4]|uniref:alginate lyase family protein n=1 Tax=Paenibacillus vietnamensis TaxID=2590547 RepID=UPI001CD17201|nr:alginate lyase family protein [Paenibacillus vietnamensis]MCA0753544.1 alginate lyase family protein [Paenibacillus vietnamensis]
MNNPTASDHLLRLAGESLSVRCHAVPVWHIPGFYFDAAGHQAAKRLMEADAQAAYTTALAYRLTGEAAYADKAAELIDGWASVNRALADNDGPLVSAYLGTGLIRAAELLKAYSDWRTEAQERFVRWMTGVCLPEWDRIPLRNNWWSWSLYAQLSLFRFLDDKDRFAEETANLKEQIDHSLAPAGFIPEETNRGKNSIWYHYFALAPLTAAAKQIMDVTGENLFRWTSPSGASIKKSLDTLMYYTDGRAAEWPYGKDQNVPAPLSSDTWPLDLFGAMSGIYGDPEYERFVSPYRPIIGNTNKNSGYFQSYAWVYPELQLD